MGKALSPEEMSAFGADGVWTMARIHDIRWSHCDLFGHMNHAAYLNLFEDLRVDYWAAMTGESVSLARPGPVVAQIEARYIQPVRYREQVLLTARTVSLRRTSFVQEYALWRGGLACSARAVCVLVVNETGERVAISSEVRSKMIGTEGAQEDLQSADRARHTHPRKEALRAAAS